MRIRIIIPIIAILVVVLVVIYGHNRSDSKNNSINMKEVATVKTPIISPSGMYQLKIIEETVNNVKHNRFAIFKVSNGNPGQVAIFTSKDAFRTRDTLYFVWDKNNRVWVYSGDVGTFFWERLSDGNWQKHTFADNKNVPVPESLKRLNPGYFNSN